MNVIVANENQNQLSNIDIDIIKSINGVFSVSELVDMFKNFFYSKMILDVTSLKNYKEISTYEELAKGLDTNKIIFLLPEGSSLCTPNFLSSMIDLGIYNFTTNLNGIRFLIKKSNTLQDVENIKKMAQGSKEPEVSNNNSSNNSTDITTPTEIAPKAGNNTTVIGIKNVTESAGATTLIFMLKKELVMTYGSEKVLAIELEKNDFSLFNDQNMFSNSDSTIKEVISKNQDKNIILIDLNNCHDTSFCNEIIYLIEPSTIKLNKLVRDNKIIFGKIADKKIVLNKSLLLTNDVADFEKESGLKVFYNMPPLDERKRNTIINDFLIHLGLLADDSREVDSSNRIFGLFRR